MQTYDPEIKESDNFVPLTSLLPEQLRRFEETVVPIINDSPMMVILDNVLTSEECANMIQFINNYEQIRQGNFNRKKLIINCEELSKLFVERVHEYLPISLSTGKKNCRLMRTIDDGAGNNPTECWELDLINPAWRLVKGDLNSKLPKHFDGSYVKSIDYRSIYTVLVYLNDSDGDTRFYYRPSSDCTGSAMESDGNSHTTIVTGKYVDVTPRRGRFVIFHQSLEHEGLVNTDHHKYFIRSEMMYYRKESIEQETDREAMKKYMQARECFFTDVDRSERLEIEAFRLSPKLEDLILGL